MKYLQNLFLICISAGPVFRAPTGSARESALELFLGAFQIGCVDTQLLLGTALEDGSEDAAAVDNELRSTATDAADLFDPTRGHPGDSGESLGELGHLRTEVGEGGVSSAVL